MVTFEFILTDEDFDRLFILKQKDGLDNLTGNEYARELLEKELRRRYPKIPRTDENGNYIIE